MQTHDSKLLPSLTRRLFLGGASVAALPLPMASAMTVDAFLSKATPAEKVRYHSNELMEALASMHPDKLGWRVHVNHEQPFVWVASTASQGVKFKFEGM